MPKTRANIITEAILKYADGNVAEAIDDQLGHPEQDVFDRYIADLAAEIDRALNEGEESA